jgi:hypothetical protein
MGGSPKQVNSGQASQANTAANASEQQSGALSAENLREQQQNFNYLFGQNGKGGSLTPFMDPNSLNASKPTGAYAAGLNNTNNQVAKDYANQRGSLAQSWANRGSANGAPSGFQADQERKLGQSEADTRGNLFAETVGQQHQDALNNFWNANAIASGQASGARTGALQGAENQGSTAANIYGTAGRQAAPSAIPGALIGAGGAAGAAALGNPTLMCPARGAKIRTKRGDVAVEDLHLSDQILQFNARYFPLLELPVPVSTSVIAIETQRGHRTLVGDRHAFVSPGGYVEAHESKLAVVKVHGGEDLIEKVIPAGEFDVFPLKVGGNHSYLCDGFWSLD